jgi:hypothetical protein
MEGGGIRGTCAKLDPAGEADECTGKVLSCAPDGMDGAWPCEPVRDVRRTSSENP